MNVLIATAGKVLLNMLLSFAGERAFQELVLWLAEKGVKRSDTTWDDELLEQLKKNLAETQKRNG